MGMSLVYGVTGSLSSTRSPRRSRRQRPGQPVTSAAIVLTLAGFVFKVVGGAVPRLGARHLPGRAGAGRGVPVGGLQDRRLRRAGRCCCSSASGPYADVWGPVLAVLAVLTMTVGNLVALRQRHAVRLLAWSSVAQAGYILVPLGVAASHHGRAGVAAPRPSRRCWPTSRSTPR